MKILFVTTVYPTKEENFRGIYIQNRAKALIKKGIDVKVALFSESTKTEATDNFTSLFLFKSNHRKFFKKVVSLDNSFNIFMSDFKPDLIIFFIAPVYFEEKVIKEFPTYKYGKFYEGRNIYYEFSSKLPKFVQHIQCLKKKSFIKKLDYVFLCSSLLLNDFNSQKYRNPKFKVKVLTNGFDQEIFTPLTKEKVFDTSKIKIIAVGNLTKLKGFIRLITDVCDVFSSSSTSVELTIIGTGNIESEIKDFGYPDNVKLNFIRQLSQHELLKYFQNNDYFILPSMYESFGCVYLEAMSQGLIAVGCKNQGPSVFINDGINGFLVSDSNDNSLKDLLLQIKQNKINCEKISKKAIGDSKKYSWDAFADLFIKEVSF